MTIFLAPPWQFQTKIKQKKDGGGTSAQSYQNVELSEILASLLSSLRMDLNLRAHHIYTTRFTTVIPAVKWKNLSILPLLRFGGIHPICPPLLVIFMTMDKRKLLRKLPIDMEDMLRAIPIAFNPSGVWPPKNSIWPTYMNASDIPIRTYCGACQNMLSELLWPSPAMACSNLWCSTSAAAKIPTIATTNPMPIRWSSDGSLGLFLMIFLYKGMMSLS